MYASRLRAALASYVDEPPALISTADGYLLKVDRADTDAGRFTALVEEAGRTDDLERRTALLTEALALWRGEPLKDVAPMELRRQVCAGLQETRRAAVAARVDAGLGLGKHEELVDEVTALTADDPGDERLARSAMLALYRCGRRDEALKVYDVCAAELAESLGLDPGRALTDLRDAIERDDVGPDPKNPATPRELPADITVLAGRDELIADLVSTLKEPVKKMVCLYGGAGMGKSALAARLGHLVASAYPDGQLFARLQTPDGERVPPRLTAGRMLRSLGIPAPAVPEDEAERIDLLRTTLADRAVLVVLDDAMDADQVQALRPDGARCGVVITSRRRLPGLTEVEQHELGALDESRGRRLLAELTGAAEVDDVYERIVRYCAGVPLALRIVGLQLAFAGGAGADRLAAALADDARRLDSLVAGDLAVRTSLDIAFGALDPEARTLFARLSLLHVDEFSPWVAAPLLACDEASAERAIERLAEFGMLQVRRIQPRRFGMHGLSRAYAAEQNTDTQAERRYLEALLRLTTRADEDLSHSMRPAEGLTAPPGDALPKAEADAVEPGWLDLETPAIVVAVSRAAALNEPELAATLALRLNGHLAVRHDRDARHAVLRIAREAIAGRTDLGELSARVELAIAGAMAQGDAFAAELRGQAERAVEAARRVDNPRLQVLSLAYLGHYLHWAGDIDAASRTYQASLDLLESRPELADLRSGELTNIATLRRDHGDLNGAIAMYREAAGLAEDAPRRQAIILRNLAEALALAGLVDEMAEAVERADRLVTELGDELGKAHILTARARLVLLRGDTGDCRRLLAQAEDILERHPDFSGTQWITLYRAELELADGDPQRARQVLLDGIEQADAEGFPLAAWRCRQALNQIVK